MCSEIQQELAASEGASITGFRQPQHVAVGELHIQ
jgi:hypothetical protein